LARGSGSLSSGTLKCARRVSRAEVSRRLNRYLTEGDLFGASRFLNDAGIYYLPGVRFTPIRLLRRIEELAERRVSGSVRRASG
jgi:hypothetical protein